MLDNYGFDILESNRRDGRIETATRIAPGLGLYIKPGSPDVRERALASLQTYRHRVTVLIAESKEQGGMFIDVKVRKELEDLARPQKSTIGAAIFRVDNDLDRHFEVIDDATTPIPAGSIEAVIPPWNRNSFASSGRRWDCRRSWDVVGMASRAP